MNLTHMKYALEVEKEHSISRAAANLFMGQPNLSRAISELEEHLGIKIFRRTAKGMYPTPQGEEFLGYAKSIMGQIDAIEDIYRGRGRVSQRFSAAAPKAMYISCAFTELSKYVKLDESAEIFYHEANSPAIIDDILNNDCNLGILRYKAEQRDNYFRLFKERGVSAELICEFKFCVAVSERSPLNKKERITKEDLAPYMEISHADPYVPVFPSLSSQKTRLSDKVNKRIYVFERASQLDLLGSNENTFMWVSPIPRRILKMYGISVKYNTYYNQVYNDVLVYRKGYIFTELDKRFIDALVRLKPGNAAEY
ncbi:MAG: LysR family transcriptional regulator [Clostridia bacterium]|nr:LysR family transcriptional regulator [Clostridia bacterium]